MAEAPRLALVRTATDQLDAAVRRAVARVEAAIPEGDPRGDASIAGMGLIAAAVRARIEDPTLGPVDPGLATDPVFEPFLEAITRDLLEREADAESARPTLQVLRAVARVRSAAAADGSASDGGVELSSRLRAPDAFELLVEVAHDFRSPLTSILFLAETMRDGNSGPVTELQRSQLGLIYSAAFGLAAVASDVMDLARREKGLVGDEPRPYALAEVFDSVARLVSPIVEEKGLELRVDAPDRARAHGHPHALSRVMLNLTTNALKFTDEGHVTIGAKPLPRSLLEFYVQDTGRGIPPARQAELYQPFKRRLGEKQEGHFFSGSGVGLSIARRLVRAMGSDLVLETSDERGTRFSFQVVRSPARHRAT